ARSTDGGRGYLARHARGTATARDFLDAIAGVASPEVRDAFAGFLDQPGVPLVRATLRCDAGRRPTLELAQERLGEARAAGAWKVPLCLHAESASGRTFERCDLIGARASLELGGDDCPRTVVANAGAAGYY